MIGISLIIKIFNKLILDKINLPPLYECSVAVIGLGYVGLPLLISIANQKYCILSKKKCSRRVVGFDIDKMRIKELEQGLDRNKIFPKRIINKTDFIDFSYNENILKNIDVFIITVPTPIDQDKNPDLFHLIEASKLVGKSIKENVKNIFNKVIIYESTVYPGVTEEICMPIVEKYSGIKFNSESDNNTFYCGYSPERINPGDKNHDINNIVKVTSGCNKIVTTWVDKFYGSFIKAGTFKTKSIKIAEAAKIIENTQRDINIALINELSMLFKKLNIETKDVLEAAGTKWNFHNYNPGLVGGHCIGVDPYYLTHKAKEIGFNTKLISAGRKINDFMHEFLLQQILSSINKTNKIIKNQRVLLLGLSYKSNCSDIRNSQLIYLVEKLKKRNFKVTVVDPKVNPKSVFLETGLNPFATIPKKDKYSIIIFALDHEEFNNLSLDKLLSFLDKDGKIFDLVNKFPDSNVFHL